MAKWQLKITPVALQHLRAISDKRIRKSVAKRINELAEEAEELGKPLVAESAGYYSVRAVGQRYRIIYQIELEAAVVTVVTVGIRKEGDKADAYELAQRLLRQGMLEP